MVLDWSRATVLSLDEFEVCWELLGLGETPGQLDPPSSGRTAEERRWIVAAVGAELRRRGLGDGRGPHPVVAEMMRMLAHAELVLDVRVRAERLVAGLAACRGDRCTLAVRCGAEIAVLGLPADAAAPALVELIGAVQPGPGAVVAVPAAVLDAARAAAPDDPVRFADELVRRGTARTDADHLVRMCTGVRRRGQFGVTAHGSGGRRRRAAYVVGTHRTAQGDYRQVRRQGTVTVGPVSGRDLLDDMAELVAATGARRH
jgi:hypothetical protein